MALRRREHSGIPLPAKADCGTEIHGGAWQGGRGSREKEGAEGSGKYQGTMDFNIKDRVFILSVMMKNERREEDGFRSDR